MKVYRHLDEVPSSFASVLSIGNFDGVHLAHQQVLRGVVERARALGVQAVAVTFEPHPLRILRPEDAPRLITPLARKLELLQATGIDAVLLLPFTRDLSLTPPREFVESILVRALHAREIHEGANFHFGYRAQGDVQRLREAGDEFGFAVRVYSELTVRGDVVSSSRIRELLQTGKVDRARRLLGRPFAIATNAGRGRGYGQKYTVPTINLSHYDELVPGDGVYVTQTRVGNELFESVTNVGNRPTFGDPSFAIESHLLDFHPVEVSSETDVEIAFLLRLRAEIKFPSVDALRQQIAHDIARAQHYFRINDSIRRCRAASFEARASQSQA